MINKHFYLAIVACLFGVAVCNHSVAQAAQDTSPTVSSSNQSGGVTAYHVDNVNNYNRSTDPLRDKLAATMISFNRQLAESYRGALDAPGYTLWIDAKDKAFQNLSGEPNLYIFLVSDEPLIDDELKVASCKIQPKFSSERFLYGITYTTSTNGNTSQVSMNFITDINDPVLKSLCHGLSAPLNSITGHKTNSITIYDYLAQYSDGITIAMFPVTPGKRPYDIQLVEDYWKNGIATQYNGSGPSMSALLSNPVNSESLYSFMENGEGANFEISGINAGTEALNFDKYPDSVLNDYGGKIEIMESEWRNFLQMQKIALNSGVKPLYVNGTSQRVLKIYTLSDIQRPDFWSHLSDLKQFMNQLTCLGSQFAIEKGYASVPDLPDYSVCAQWRGLAQH